MASAVGFPTGGNFRIIIDSEIMLVTAVQGKTFTVTRAQEGTSAASHNAAAAVFHVLTAGSLAQRDIEQFATGAIANCDAAGQAGRLYMPTEGLVNQDNGSAWDMMPFHRFTPPVSTDYTWVNQGSSTVADTKGMMVLRPVDVASGDNLRCLGQGRACASLRVHGRHAGPESALSRLLSDRTIRHLLARKRFGQAPHLRLGHEQLPAQFQLRPVDQSHDAFRAVSSRFRHRSTIRSGFASRTMGQIARSRFPAMGSVSSRCALPRAGRCFCTADQIGVFANSWKTANGVPRIISFLHWRQS